MTGYAVLAAGAALELATGRNVAVVAAISGGLFEVAVGIRILWRGFGEPHPTSLARTSDSKGSK